MASLKALKIRIGSVKSTQKITKALNMVAASKLRRAQQNAVAARPYSTRMTEVTSCTEVSCDSSATVSDNCLSAAVWVTTTSRASSPWPD